MKPFLIIFPVLSFSLLSCSAQSISSSTDEQLICDDCEQMWPTLSSLYVTKTSGWINAKIDEIYSRIYNNQNESFLFLKLTIIEDFFKNVGYETIYLPIQTSLSYSNNSNDKTLVDLTVRFEKNC